MTAVFWISVGVVVYTYAIYPLVISLWGSCFPRRVERRYRQRPLSVVLAVKDEEANIRARLENLLAQDYPPELVEIIVVSDASTDRTAERARELGGARVKVLETATAGGKAGALNLGVGAASHDIVVFADARQTFAADVFAELVATLSDPDVGAASGELVIGRGGGSEVHEGVGLYWEYEKLIRRQESAAGSVVGVTGCIYALRRELYVPLANHTVLDDLLVPMRAVLKGFRVVFVRSARAFDVSSATAGQEFRRKVRTLAGNLQAVAMEPALVDPVRNPVFFQLVSHKLLRLAVPYFCLLALLSNLFLDGAFYTATLVAQSLFYGLAVLHHTPVARTLLGRPARIAWTFLVLNAAAVAGLWVFLTRRGEDLWRKG